MTEKEIDTQFDLLIEYYDLDMNAFDKHQLLTITKLKLAISKGRLSISHGTDGLKIKHKLVHPVGGYSELEYGEMTGKATETMTERGVKNETLSVMKVLALLSGKDYVLFQQMKMADSRVALQLGFFLTGSSL